MKQFPVSIKGRHVPVQPWEGTVLSVYGKAVNILHPDGFLVSVLKNGEQMSGYGLVAADLFSLMSPGDLEGIPVVCDSEKIIFEPAISIDYSMAQLWSGGVSVCRKPIPLEKLLAVYRRKAPREGFSSLILGDVSDIYTKAALAILEKVESGGIVDLSPLVGLGIGFTPSGDDFISGVMLYLRVFGEGEKASVTVDRAAITAALRKTTPGGRTLLSLVLQNSFPAYLKTFTRALCGDVYKNNAETVVSRVLTHGATSGSDALAGFFWIAGYA